jgi:phosphinothricin acetyltransferase
MTLDLRDATVADLPRIAEIYNESIGGRLATGDLVPVSVESRVDWFENHDPHTHPIWVAQINGEIAGWLSFQPFYGRAAYRKTVEISIYICPQHQRQGVGHFFLQNAIAFSPELQLSTLLGFIFAHNQPSLGLFQKNGFERWGYLPKIAELDDVERDLVILGRRV